MSERGGTGSKAGRLREENMREKSRNDEKMSKRWRE